MNTVKISDWNMFLSRFPDAHVLQSGEWGILKAAFRWKVVFVQSGEAGAQILFKQLPFGLSVGYIPKGPVGTNWRGLWKDVDAVCRQNGAIFLKVEPDAWEPELSELDGEMSGFQRGAEPIQPRRTVVLDLEGNEDDWMARMKPKTRYNIRLAQRKGVVVRVVSAQQELNLVERDLQAFYHLMQVTGRRDGFGVHSYNYYQMAFNLFAPRGQCALLLAEYEGRPLAGLMVFARGIHSWYFYGASSDEERNRMPAYLIQWEAMRWAKSRGCQEYDLWGVPDCNEEVLESGFTEREDGLWGVYRFKRGYGGNILRSVGAWEKVYVPGLYKAYRWWGRRRAE